MNSIWKVLTSLRLTVWLLGISVLLVFLGSIAQVPEGLWHAQARWFKTWVVVRTEGDPWYVLPIFPGGHLLGCLLLVNLLAAHIKRFSWNFQKFGIQLTHFGVIVLLVGQLITDKTAVESFVSFSEGEGRNFTEHHRDVELAFIQDADSQRDEVVSFPQSQVEKKGELRHEKLPFTVRVRDFGINGEVLSLSELPEAVARMKRAMAALDGKFSDPAALPAVAEADASNPARAVVWRQAIRAMGEDPTDLPAAAKKLAADPARAAKLMAQLKAQFLTEMLAAFQSSGGEMRYVGEAAAKGQLDEVINLAASSDKGAGARGHLLPQTEIRDDKQGRNMPWALVEISAGGQSLGTWLGSAMLKPQEFEVNGRKWRLALRFERYPLPFNIELVRAKQEVYLGTSQAKEYASRVRLVNPETGENRETDITMNNPLRYGGLTFYQSTMNQMGRGPGTAELLEAITGRPKEEFQAREEATGDRFSGLQVVENPSMLAPYSGCLLVGFGMLWQFLFHLTGFLSKRTGLPPPGFGVPHPILPLCAVLIVVPDLFVGWLAWKNGTLFAFAVIAVTPLIRGVLAWQIWRGRYLVFAMVLLLIPSLLVVPFALKYADTVYRDMLWPVAAAQFLALFGIAFVVFSHKSQSLPSAAQV